MAGLAGRVVEGKGTVRVMWKPSFAGPPGACSDEFLPLGLQEGRDC